MKSGQEFSQEIFNSFVIEKDVIGFFEEPVTLKSGRTSYWYVNWRSAVEDAATLDQLSDYLISFVDALHSQGKLSQHPETIFGVPEGATKLGVIAQMKWAKRCSDFGPGSHVVAMGRGKAKQHGLPRDKFFVGLPKGPTVVVEDTTTTGGSLLETLDKLIESGVEVVAAIGLSNRMQQREDGSSVADAVAALTSGGRPVQYFQMSDAAELLPQVAEKKNLTRPVREAVEAEFIACGLKQVKLL